MFPARIAQEKGTVREVRWLAWVSVLSACGRLHFDAIGGDAPSADGPRDARSADTTADAAAPLCNPTAPFTSIDSVPGVNMAGFYDSTFTPLPGELTAYFYSDRAGTMDLYVATRPDQMSVWTVAPIPALNSSSVDKEPCPSQDGSLMIFTSNRPPADAGGDFYYGTFDGASWTLGGPIANLNSGTEERHGFLELDSSDLWF